MFYESLGTNGSREKLWEKLEIYRAIPKLYSWSNVEKLFRVFYSPFETNLHSYRTEIFSSYDSSRSDENSTIFIYISLVTILIITTLKRIVHLHSRDVEISFRAIQFPTHET